ncbi:hypothetical protein [Pseudomonas sp. TMP9]|uniref:hypothetical protein n=1 Tax=Pseudomonas sp. TMP9 TaxID=3133144 RepID=UPI0030CFDA09
MRTVSFQGTQVSESQRRNLQLRAQVQTSFMAPHLLASVQQTEQLLSERKAAGVKPEKLWFVVRDEKGTSCVAEWMGY